MIENQPLTEKEVDAVDTAQAEVTAQEVVPEAFVDEMVPGIEEQPAFTGEEEQTAGLGKLAGKLVDKVLPGKAVRKALSPDSTAPGLAGNATEQEAEDLLLNQAQVGRIIDPARTPHRNISLKYIDSESDIQELIDDIAVTKDITGQPGMQPKTWETTQAEADAAELELRGIFKHTPGKVTLPDTASDLVAMRDVMTEAGRELQETSQRLLITDPATGHKTLRGDIPPDELLEYRKMINNYTAIQYHFMGQAKEVGRALNALRMPNGAPDMPMDELLKVSDPNNLRDIAVLIADAKDTAGIAGATQAGWARRTGGWMYEFWINNLLGSVGTHSKNILGNTMTSAMAIPEHYLAKGFGTLRKALRPGGEDPLSMGEVNAMSWGFVQGYSDSVSVFMNALKKDMGDTDLIDPSNLKMEYFRQPQFSAANFGFDEDKLLGKATDFLGKWYVRLPGRFLQAEDELFKSVGYRMELNRLSFRQAEREGLQPNTQAFNDRLSQLIQEPDPKTHADAIHFSRYQTFTNDLTGNLMEGVQKIQQAGPMKLLLPFLRTPTNILKYGMARTPVGLFMPSVLRDLKSGGPAADLAMARLSFTSLGVGTLAMSLNYEDEQGRYRPAITGGGPANPDTAAQWRSYGIQPYSILVGDTYYPYDAIEPFGTVMAVIADGLEAYHHSTDPEMKENVLTAMVMGLAEYTTEKSYMQGFTVALDLVRGRGLDTAASNILASGLPTSSVAMSKVARDIDPTKRETKDVSSAFGSGNAIDSWLGQVYAKAKSRSPFLSADLKPKTDVFGVDMRWNDPIAMMHSFSPAMSSALRRDQDEPLVRELAMHHVGERKPEPVINVQTKYGPLKLDILNTPIEGVNGDTLFYEYRRIVGEERREAIIKTMNSKAYARFEDLSPERSDMLGNAMNEGLDKGKKVFLKMFPEVIPAGLDRQDAGQVSAQPSIPAGVPDSLVR